MRGFKQRREIEPAQDSEADVNSAAAASSSSSHSGPATTEASRLKSISPELSSEMPTATPSPPRKRARSTFESGLREIAALTGVAFSAFEQPPTSDRRGRKSFSRNAVVSPELASPPAPATEASVIELDATRLDRPKKKKKKASGVASSYRREADALSRDCFSAAHDPKSSARGRTRSRTSFPETPSQSVDALDSPKLDTTAARPRSKSQAEDVTDTLAYAIVERASQLERHEQRRVKHELKELEQPYFAASRVPVAGSSRSGKRRTAVSDPTASEDGADLLEAAAVVGDSLASKDAADDNVPARFNTTPTVALVVEGRRATDDSDDASPSEPFATSSEPASNLRTAAERSRTVPHSDSKPVEVNSEGRAMKQRRVKNQPAEPSRTAYGEAGANATSAFDPAGDSTGTTFAPTVGFQSGQKEGDDSLGPPAERQASPLLVDGPRPETARPSDSTNSVSGLPKRQRRPPSRFDDEVDAAEAERKRARPAQNEQMKGPAKSERVSLADQKAVLKRMKIKKLPGAKVRDRSKSTATADRPLATIITRAALPADPASASGSAPETAGAAIEACNGTGPSQPDAVASGKGCAISPMSYEQLTHHLPPEHRPDDTNCTDGPVTDTCVATNSSPKKRSVAKKAASSAAIDSKQPKLRARHPALDSTETWVVPERDVTLTHEGRPPIWCEGRQELCESLDYFKSYQGGHYDSQERCLGYLLEGFGAANDICAENGKIVISHGGGCSEVVIAPGVGTEKGDRIFRLKASQTRDNLRMRALINCKDTKTPVVLIAGTQWPFFPALKSLGKKHEGDATARYAVLGHYLVTDIWAEGETIDSGEALNPTAAAAPDFFVRFKVRFEWVPSQGKPWFDQVIGGVRTAGPAATGAASEDVPMSDALSDTASLDSGFVDSTTPPPASPKQPRDVSQLVHCASCQQQHVPIYEEAITCYNEECTNFFLLDSVMPRPAALTYRQALLLTTSLPADSLVPERLMPKTLQELAGTTCISDYSERAWRGFGCSVCGRLSSRSDWLRLRCSGCGAETDATGRLSLPSDWRRVRQPGGGPNRLDPEAKPASVLPDYRIEQIQHVPGYTGYSVELLEGVDPDSGVGRAKVHHLWPCTEATFRNADGLFYAYQGAEAGKLFKRNRLTRHAAVGALLCQQFTQNAGLHYKHVIGAETYPFRTSESPPSPTDGIVYAPSCAQDGRDDLTEIVNTLKGDRYSDHTQFNEVLSVAYMTGGRMNYHDDGERGLGPFVASISLGADAIMSFRSKGAKKRRPTGAATPAKRKGPAVASPAEVEDGQLTDDVEDKAGGPAPTGEPKRSSNKSRVVLKLRLKHGDVMLMEGEDMQRKFEHKVEPEGLRFAATARFIGPDHFRPPSQVTTKPSGPSKPRRDSKAATSRFAYQDRVEEPKQVAAHEIIRSLHGVVLPKLPENATPTPMQQAQISKRETPGSTTDTATSTLQVMLNSEHRRASPFSSADFPVDSPTMPKFSEAPDPTAADDIALTRGSTLTTRAVSPNPVSAQVASELPRDDLTRDPSHATKRPFPSLSVAPPSSAKRPQLSGQGSIAARAIQSAVSQAAPPPRAAPLPRPYGHGRYPGDPSPRLYGPLHGTPAPYGPPAFPPSARHERVYGSVHRPWVPTPIAPQDPSIPSPAMYGSSTPRATFGRETGAGNGFVVKGAAGYVQAMGYGRSHF